MFVIAKLTLQNKFTAYDKKEALISAAVYIDCFFLNSLGVQLYLALKTVEK